jgi:hypothetical protein
MSKLETYNIPCPECKMSSEQMVFHSINTSIKNAAFKIVNDEINFVLCPHCNNKFQVKTGLLFNNIEKTYAVYYNPTTFASIDDECKNLKKMLGENFYLSNPSKFSDWDLFKGEIRRKEGIAPKVNLHRSQTTYGHSGRSLDSYWTCDICDGNSETGCLYFDPTECPRN